MKKILSLIFVSTLLLSACGEKPMTEAQQAESYGISVEEFRDQKQAAARMNMSIEEHMRAHAGHSM